MPHGTPAAVHAARELETKIDGPVVYAPDQAAQEALRAPGGEVYIFNVGPIEQTVEKGSAGRFTVKACELGEPYSEPLKLNRLVGDSYVVENEMKTHYVSGEFMAQDIIHPSIGASWSFGQNLDDFGVFWTRNEKPTEAELAAARAKMEVTFRKLLAMATTIEVNGNLNDITPYMRIAATYFGEDRPWNRMYRKHERCPGCGENIQQGIIRHSCGYIFDPDRALLAGMIDGAKHKELIGLRDEAEQPQRNTQPKKSRKASAERKT